MQLSEFLARKSQRSNFLRPGAVLTVFAAIGACGVIELSPDRPAIREHRYDASETSELVVVISGGSLGYEAGWVVYVDGTSRAWLPTRPSFTRIPVTPGPHEVTVAFRTRALHIIMVPLPPSANEVKAKISLNCTERARCAVKAGIHVDSKTKHLVVEGAEMGGHEVDDEVRELPYVAPG